jgi:hypothetical protein
MSVRQQCSVAADRAVLPAVATPACYCLRLIYRLPRLLYKGPFPR